MTTTPPRPLTAPARTENTPGAGPKEQHTTDQTLTTTRTTDRSARPVVEHALIDYGYSPHVVQALLDQLADEARAE
ncbi:hypothetical protein ACFWGI_36635 [Streptomyces niveus]|uniref:hypothetical protein n=1 Tax=Streptomyces niveus TaxID=193462 RepID=UPI003660318A